MNDTYLDELNDAQRQAVEYNDGPALVIAGAGSGKTRVLVYKLLHLMSQGYRPHALMALTFTNKAAREMRERIYRLIGSEAYSIRMGTFHSIFLRILRMYADLLGYTPSFTVYNATDSKTKIKAIIKLLALDEKYYKPSYVHSRISNAKNRLQSAEGYRSDMQQAKQDTQNGVPRIGEIYALYSLELKRANAMDFDDLLMQTNILLRDYPEVLAELQRSIDYLLIDEYQDTNFAQYMIARQLMQHKGNIFVVGDDAQSIYSFRGADINNMLGFERIFPNTKVFKLEQNYRSSRTIVQAAQALIAQNEHQLHKQVFSLGEVGEPIEIYVAPTGEAEAMWVCRTIEEIKSNTREEYDAFAVLYRTNHQSRLLEQKMRAHAIPFRIWGGHSFFDYKEIMDVMAYFRIVVNELDDEAIYRVINYPRRGIGDTTVAKIRQRAVETNTSAIKIIQSPLEYGLNVNKGTEAKLRDFANLIGRMHRCYLDGGDFYSSMEELIKMSGIPSELILDKTAEGKARRDNIQELLVSLEEYSRGSKESGDLPTLEGYLSEIALLSDVNPQGEEGETKGVTLMTVHASKGLEFPHVFIVGLEEQLFPSAMCQDAREIEEERRLLYVAITRSAKTCHMAYARERFRNGRVELTRPSRFLREIPEALTKHSNLPLISLKVGGHLPQEFTRERGSMLHDSMLEYSKPSKYISSRDVATQEEQHQQVGDLVIGGRVSHARFGEGVIKGLEGSGDNIKALVLFDEVGEKKLLLRFAHLVAL